MPSQKYVLDFSQVRRPSCFIPLRISNRSRYVVIYKSFFSIRIHTYFSHMDGNYVRYFVDKDISRLKFLIGQSEHVRENENSIEASACGGEEIFLYVCIWCAWVALGAFRGKTFSHYSKSSKPPYINTYECACVCAFLVQLQSSLAHARTRRLMTPINCSILPSALPVMNFQARS